MTRLYEIILVYLPIKGLNSSTQINSYEDLGIANRKKRPINNLRPLQIAARQHCQSRQTHQHTVPKEVNGFTCQQPNKQTLQHWLTQIFESTLASSLGRICMYFVARCAYRQNIMQCRIQWFEGFAGRVFLLECFVGNRVTLPTFWETST